MQIKFLNDFSIRRNLTVTEFMLSKIRTPDALARNRNQNVRILIAQHASARMHLHQLHRVPLPSASLRPPQAKNGKQSRKTLITGDCSTTSQCTMFGSIEYKLLIETRTKHITAMAAPPLITTRWHALPMAAVHYAPSRTTRYRQPPLQNRSTEQPLHVFFHRPGLPCTRVVL